MIVNIVKLIYVCCAFIDIGMHETFLGLLQNHKIKDIDEVCELLR